MGDGTKAENPEEKVEAKPDSAEKWIKQLDSESYAKRCEAQAQCDKLRGEDATLLQSALTLQKIGVYGRMHAVWVIARGERTIDLGYPNGMSILFRVAKEDPSASVRLQAVRAIADLADPVLEKHRLNARMDDRRGVRERDLGRSFASLIPNQIGGVQLEIIVALGRLRWPGVPDLVREARGEPTPPLAHAATWAIQRSANWPAVFKLVDLPAAGLPSANRQREIALRQIGLHALAVQYEPQVADGLIERLKVEKDAGRRREYADLLSRIHNQPAPWVYWNYRPAPRPANSVAWERTEAIAAALDGALADPDQVVRLAVLRRMQREKVPVRLPTLLAWLTSERDAEAVATILTSLRDQTAASVRAHVVAILSNARHSLPNRQAALAIFVTGIDKEHPDSLLALSDTLEDGPVLAEALRLLSHYPKLAAAPLLVRKLNSENPEVRAAAIETLGDLRRRSREHR